MSTVDELAAGFQDWKRFSGATNERIEALAWAKLVAGEPIDPNRSAQSWDNEVAPWPGSDGEAEAAGTAVKIKGLAIIQRSANKATVPTVAALRALTAADLAPLNSIDLLGYYTAGDGGGSQLFLDSSDTTTPDNGGSCFVVGGVRIKLAATDAVRVEQFGAKGDGVTFDADAINAAIAYGTAASIPIVLTKTYRLNKAVKLKTGTVLDGQGTGTLIRAFENFALNRSAIENENRWDPYSDQHASEIPINVRHVQLHNLKVIQDKNVVGGNLLCLWGVEDVLVSNCTIGGPFESGGAQRNEWVTSLIGNDMVFDSCHIENMGGVFCDGLHIAGGRRYRVSNCRLIGGDDALAVLNVLDHPISDVAITNCVITSYNAHCIRVGVDSAVPVVPPTPRVNYVERISISNIVAESGLRNGLIRVDCGAEKLVRKISISNVNGTMNPGFNNLGVTQGYAVNVINCVDVDLSNIKIFNAGMESSFTNVDRLTVNGLYLRNTQLRSLVVTSVADLTMVGLDLSNDRAWDALRVVDCAVVKLFDSTIQTLTNNAVSYTNTIGNGVLKLSRCRFLGTGPGLQLQTGLVELSVVDCFFAAALSPKIGYPGSVAPTNTYQVGNVGIQDLIKGPGLARVYDARPVTYRVSDFNPLWRAERTSTATYENFSMASGHPTYESNSNWHQFQQPYGIQLRNNNNDATTKLASLALTHYTLAEEPVCGVLIESVSGENTVTLGGGSTAFNACNTIKFRIGATPTTTNGAEVSRMTAVGLRIQPAGIAANARRPLDILSTTGGIMLPVHTTAEANAIASPLSGELLYNGTLGFPEYHDGTKRWQIQGTLRGQITHDFPSIAPGASADSPDITVTGAAVGDPVIVADPGLTSQVIFKAWVTATDTVRIRAVNAGSVATDLVSATFYVFVFRR